MVDGYKCDRCREWNEAANGMGSLRLKVFGRSMNADYPADIDLCRDCCEGFAEFMTGGDD